METEIDWKKAGYGSREAATIAALTAEVNELHAIKDDLLVALEAMVEDHELRFGVTDACGGCSGCRGRNAIEKARNA